MGASARFARRAGTCAVATAASTALLLVATPPRAAASSSPAVGAIQGNVQVVTPSSRRLASAGAYPSRIVTLPANHNASELANVVVFVKAGPVASSPMRAAIRQIDEEFVPHLVAITAGSTVDFPNDDLIFHNVFSLSRSNAFDLGRYPRGQSKSRAFRSPGLIKVYCHLHSQMSALIRVLDNPYFAIPDEEGNYTIDNVPSGTYDVVAWHERVGEVTGKTTVTTGRPAVLSFSLPLADQ